MAKHEKLQFDRKLADTPLTCGGNVHETYVGMAHFAGGTPGMFCRQCRFHGMTRGKKMSRVDFNSVKAFPCAKARQMGCKTSQNVPANAHACKYFEPKGGS